MKFIRKTGCNAWSYTIDGKELIELTNEEKLEAFNRIVPALKKALMDNNVDLFDILDSIEADLYESTDRPCDSCGDYIHTETWEI